MRPVIIVRPEPGAHATAARAAALGLEARTVPLFVIEPVPWAVPDPADFDALLLSSANAVRHAGPELAALASLPCYAVGAATAAAASEAGLTVVAHGQGGAQALVDAMTSSGYRAILWLTGEERTEISGGAARVTPLVCYRAAEIAQPPGWAEAIVLSAVLLLHSDRAARRAALLAGPARKHLIALAISETVAAAAGAGWEQSCAAPRPTDTDMLAMAAKLCQTPPP
jgi:uroporphyrinogen-III synthase